MMRVDRAPTPRGFVEKVFEPGRAWLKNNPHPTPVKPFWLTAKLDSGLTCSEELAKSYHRICAYSLFRVRVSFDVEHFMPKQNPANRNLAYVWCNYRLADSRLNIWKHTTQLPDPFKVGINACTINFNKDAIIEVDRSLPGWKALENAITTLRLNKGAIKTDRYEAYLQYLSDKPQEHIGIIPLTQNSPFVAYEMLRQGYIQPQDRMTCVRVLHETGFSWV